MSATRESSANVRRKRARKLPEIVQTIDDLYEVARHVVEKRINVLRFPIRLELSIDDLEEPFTPERPGDTALVALRVIMRSIRVRDGHIDDPKADIQVRIGLVNLKPGTPRSFVESEILSATYERVRVIVLHELAESFRVDGDTIYDDPHVSGASGIRVEQIHVDPTPW